MNIIYQNTIKGMGADAVEFLDEKMFVIFGDSAPDEVKEASFWVDVTPLNGTIAPGQTLQIDGDSYKITAVGSEVPVTLEGLGHCSFKFSGQTEVELLGTIYVEDKPLPDLKIGSVIQIIEA